MHHNLYRAILCLIFMACMVSIAPKKSHYSTINYTYIISLQQTPFTVDLQAHYKGNLYTFGPEGILNFQEPTYKMSWDIIIVLPENIKHVRKNNLHHVELLDPTSCNWYQINRTESDDSWSITVLPNAKKSKRLPAGALIIYCDPTMLNLKTIELAGTTSSHKKSGSIVHLPQLAWKVPITEDSFTKIQEQCTQAVLQQIDHNPYQNSIPCISRKCGSCKQALPAKDLCQ